jgi:DNA-directed RNA polymerase subunit alpha
MPREALKKEKVEIGTIFTDAFFSPIKRATYEVENMRVGDRTDFHKIRLSIETDGTLSAREALESALKTLLDQTRAILDLKEQEEHRAEVAAKIMEHLSEQKSESKEVAAESGRDLTDVLKTRIDSLQLSTRTANALSGGGIRTLGGLIQKTKEDLLELEGFGEKGLVEVEELLTGFGLALKK